MNITYAYSTKKTARDVVKDITTQLHGFDTRLLIFFASSKFRPAVISAAIHKAFPKSVVFGCSTAGEIVSGNLLQDSVVAMAFNSRAITDCKVEIIDNLKEPDAVKKAMDSFSAHYKSPVTKMDPRKYVGIVLIDGLSFAEEDLMQKISSMTNVHFIGGSAGDDLKYKSTYIYANGKSFANAALLALIKPATQFAFIKTQSLDNVGKTLEITSANKEKREVISIDNRPAAAAYADAVGTDFVNLSKYFMKNPLGFMLENELYVITPQQILDNGNIKFYSSVNEGMELSLLRPSDIIADTKAAIKKADDELGGISGLLMFNCVMRTLELYENDQADQYGALFADIPTAGFSTYGEQYIVNLTLTSLMLAFK